MVEIYVSTDVEADGPIPGPYSMLSFASAAFVVGEAVGETLDIEKRMIGTFSANLETLPGTSGHPFTMEWWSRHPGAWEDCRRDPQPPEVAMKNYVSWVESLPGVPVFVAYPLGFDFMFVCWYLVRFTGESPFRHRGIDIRTYAMAMKKKGYKELSIRNMPEHWFDDLPHNTHRALDDAIEQGVVFCNMLAENMKTARNHRRHPF